MGGRQDESGLCRRLDRAREPGHAG